MLVPVIGLVQVGLEAMADRYTYLPFVGVFIMIAWGVSDIVDEWRYQRSADHRKPLIPTLSSSEGERETAQFGAAEESARKDERKPLIRRRGDAMAGQAPALSPSPMESGRAEGEREASGGAGLPDAGKDAGAPSGLRAGVLGAGAMVVLMVCLTLTAGQVRLWKDTETLFRHTLAVTLNNAHAHLNLGAALAWRGKLDDAAEHFAEAVRIQPDYAEALSNLGFARAAQGKIDEAIGLYRSGLAMKPKMAQTHFLLGSALNTQGKRAEALAEYRTALQPKPNH